MEERQYLFFGTLYIFPSLSTASYPLDLPISSWPDLMALESFSLNICLFFKFHLRFANIQQNMKEYLAHILKKG